MVMGGAIFLMGYLPVAISYFYFNGEINRDVTPAKCVPGVVAASANKLAAAVNSVEEWHPWFTVKRCAILRKLGLDAGCGDVGHFLRICHDSSGCAAGVFSNSMYDSFNSETSKDSTITAIFVRNLVNKDICNAVAKESFINSGLTENVIVATTNKSTAKSSTSPSSPMVRKISPQHDFSINTLRSGKFAGMVIAKGCINFNFYQDAINMGIPAGTVDSVIKSMSPNIKLWHALKRGDKFEIVYSKKGKVAYAKIMRSKGKEVSVYEPVYNSGRPSTAKPSVLSPKPDAYYIVRTSGAAAIGNSGNSRHMFGPPLSHLRVSGGYGPRINPINGVLHYHNGVDFSAAHGTPVYAICDGTVTRCCYYFGYGHCIDLKHSSGYSSRYAHLSRYAVRYGSQVKKGQIIGYVGSTGHSTGPHLHLELAKNNASINPLGANMITYKNKLVIAAASSNRTAIKRRKFGSAMRKN
jgi:murein DD-endopeptidase MepM/ murein hydrolase activator NlpD